MEQKHYDDIDLPMFSPSGANTDLCIVYECIAPLGQTMKLFMCLQLNTDDADFTDKNGLKINE